MVNLQLGDDLKLHEIMELEDLAIMGQFPGKRMNG
jgi:hypothetical protein